jgi:peptidoglycan/LPS O-acetylase OafA/YrhL
MNPNESVRRHDFDALRAFAMLVGIALHAALSFVRFPWAVQDSQQHEGFGLFFFAVHGFRMPVFFVMSGFFTAMLWRRRGLVSLLGLRLRRVFLPCLLGLFTVIPAVNWASGFVSSAGPPARTVAGEVLVTPERSGEEIDDLWTAVRAGELGEVDKFLARGESVHAKDEGGVTLLHWAAVLGREGIVERLLTEGADVNAKDASGGTPLHWTVFLGEPDMVEQLLKAGADPNAKNNKGETALDTAPPWSRELAGITEWIAGILGLEVDLEKIEEDRPAVIAALERGGAQKRSGAGGGDPLGKLIGWLMFTPVFHHLWFLWFLCWLIAGFAVYALFADLVGFRGLPDLLVVSPLRYLWLVPVTWLPQLVMHSVGESPGFGPDTSVGWLPFPHLLFYYAIFFFFGVLYYDSEDGGGQLGRRWWLTLPFALLIVFPLGLEFSMVGSWSHELGGLRHLLGALLEVVYTWLMVFGLMGMFRRLCSRERPAMRYVSDSSYWLYLAHLPLIFLGQWFVRDWPLPALIKFPLVCAVVTGLLLLTYRYGVRYTWLGTFLNGPRKRPLLSDP